MVHYIFSEGFNPFWTFAAHWDLIEPYHCMKPHFDLQNGTRDSQTSMKVNGQLSSQSKESRKLGYRLKFEKPDADFSCELVENVNTIPRGSAELPQNRQADRKGKQNEELIRFMSNLPSFLERGENVRERAFSVGVLEWRSLEKWQQFHNIGNSNSPSSSNTVLFSSTERASSHSSRGLSRSPAREKLHLPTTQHHIYGPKIEVSSRDFEFADGSDLKSKDLKIGSSGFLNDQQGVLDRHQSSDKNTWPNDRKGKDADFPRSSVTRRSRWSEDFKGKMNIQDHESFRRPDKLRARASFDDGITDQRCTRNQDQVIPDLPKDVIDNRCSSIIQPSVSTDKKNWGWRKASRQSFSVVSNSNSLDTELSCDVIEQPYSDDSNKSKISDELVQLVPNSRNISVSPSSGKKLQEKTSSTTLKYPTGTKLSEGPNPENATVETNKSRNPSPTRRFSISMGRLGRISTSSIMSSTPHLSAKDCTVTSGAAEANLSSSTLNKSKAPGKERTSPLRRLLDTLIKPKVENSDHSAEASLSDSKSSNRACKLLEDQGESTTLHSVKVKLDFENCKEVDAEVPKCSSKDGSSTVQALLQVAVKNAIPLFTFAVDNKNDILAATLRKLSSSEKDEYSWMYTFFVIQETKKRSGSWINQRNKNRGNGYTPNVVAQMKVSDALIKQNPLDQCILKKFVLYGMDAADKQTSDLQLNDELAAVVVKLSKTTTTSIYRQCNGSSYSTAASSLEETSQNESETSGAGKSKTEDQISMNVILPGGHHGLPMKGEPSTLIERWKSGGSCDCGGWDLGCRMKILADRSQCSLSSTTEDRYNSGRIELFAQGEEPDQKPVFSLSPFKDGIFSVEFDSSIKILQAFSISLSVLSCIKPTELSETSKSLEKASEDDTVSETDGTKDCSRTQKEFPAKYVAYPPLSPVGRV